jgi:dinuclear metal center YbgI/SA1388 family protein
MMNLAQIKSFLDTTYPLAYQESYDNAGLITGNLNQDITSALISLDCTEEVLDEAIAHNCNMVICHHPIVFKGLKKLTGANYVERVIIKAIKNDIAIYAAHTNVDNMHLGVNAKICEKLGLKNCTILAPSSGNLQKLYTYAPKANAEDVMQALFAVGAGIIGNYSECSFSTSGQGTFRPSAGANPKIGQAGGGREQVEEVKIEVIYPKHLKNKVMQALHALTYYEEKAYEVLDLANTNQYTGSGMMGSFDEAMSPLEVLQKVKNTFNCAVIKHTAILDKKVQKVAVCGGSGSFLVHNAIAAGADMYITSDIKYHEFFDADGQLIVADIGHYESEQFTGEIFMAAIREKFPNFAVLLSKGNSNPVKYFI